MTEHTNPKPTISYQSIVTDLPTIQVQQATERDQGSVPRSTDSKWALMRNGEPR